MDPTAATIQAWIAIVAVLIGAASFAFTTYNVWLYRKALQAEHDYQVWLAGELSRRTRETLVVLSEIPRKQMPYVQRAMASGLLGPRDDKKAGSLAWRAVY